MPRNALASLLADRADSIAWDGIPPRAVEQAKWAILDVIGVMVAGAETELGGRFVRHLERYGGPGPASVTTLPATWSPIDAARTNAALAHLLDYDDRGHASTHLFATALAVAELRPADGRAFLRAYVLGREVRVALDQIVDAGRMEGGGPGSRGWHSTGVDGPIASALTAALLLGCDPPRIAMAMGMAASSASGLIANFGTGTKPLHAGRAAAEGVTAALLAEDGVDADPAAIEGPSGLFEALGVDREEAAAKVVERFGRTWDLVERGVRIKPYPSCTTTHAGIETALRLRERVGPVPMERVARLRMDLRPFMLRRMEPDGATPARFNMAHGVLTALAEGRVEAGDYDDERIRSLGADGVFGRAEHVEGSTDLEIELADGTLIREPLVPFRNLTSFDEIEAKFRDNTVRRWPRDHQDRVVAAVAGLHGTADVRELGALLRVARGAA